MKKVFLTGASSGIGLAIAHHLSKAGYEVWGTSRHLSRLPSLPHFHPVELNLLQLDSLPSCLAEVGDFDILINNAGAGIFGAPSDFRAEHLRSQLDLLYTAPIELIRLALPAMRQRNRGTILNITSLAAQFPVPYLGPYSAAKAALSNYTQTLRAELSGSGITVIELQPGDIRSDFQTATTRLSHDTAAEKIWTKLNQQMSAAPSADLVAAKVLRLLQPAATSGLYTVGSFFQATVSPLLARVFPRAWVEWGMRCYYQ